MRKLILIIVLILPSCVYSQWVTLTSGTTQNLSAVQFLDAQTGYSAGAGGTVIKTTNGGNNWTTLNTGSSVVLRGVYFFNPSTGLVCGFSGTILRTTNGGGNWSTVTSGTTEHLLGLSFFGSSAGVSCGNLGTVLYTTNGGANWQTGQPTGYLVSFYSAFMVNASTGYCVGVNTIFSPLVAKSTDGGANWIYSSFLLNNNEGTLRDIHIFDTQNGIAVSNLWNGQGGVSRTTNGGVNWTTQIFSLGLYGVDFPSSSIGFTVGLTGTIMKSTDSGLNWTPQTSGISVFLSSVDFIDSLTGYACGDAGTVLKTTNGGITSVSGNQNEIPEKFYLFQNYPNPFNPKSNIKFQISKLSEVKLAILDILGREVAELINERLSPGSYEVNWDASGYPSGVYFYKLTTGYYTETRKMILLK
jgi:photosystem II stability/assembly factor-like uncharacterized protein